MSKDALPIRTDLHLLARVRFEDSNGEPRECFGNILELGPRTVRLESGRPLETGCRIQLQVAFPGQRQYAHRLVQLSYVVRGPHDEPNLHYDLDAATTQEKESQERLSLYLRRGPTQASAEA